MTEREKSQIIDYYLKGYNIDEIALIMPFKQYEIRNTVKGLKRAEKVIRGRNADIINDVENGITDVNVLCKKYHISKASVYRIVKTGHRKPHYVKSKTAEIVEDLKRGDLTQSEIARKHNVTKQAVFICKKKFL